LEKEPGPAWLYDLLKPYVTKVVVCNPRRNALLKTGNKSDRIDARKLAELLRAGLLWAVFTRAGFFSGNRRPSLCSLASEARTASESAREG
jgi:hypothetical protein